MIQLLDFSRTKILMLTNLKDYHVVETIDGNKTLYFSLPISDSQNNNIKLEYYVQNDTNRYVIKEKHSAGDWYDYVCQLDLDDFKANTYESYPSSYSCSQYLYYLMPQYENGLYWTSECTEYARKTLDLRGMSRYEALKTVIKEFNLEVRIDCINHKITAAYLIIDDKGCYFMEDLNLKKLDIDSDTNDIVTSLIPYGKDGMTIASVNNSYAYLDNYSYTSKTILGVWTDERYTSASELKNAATRKLEELCKPATTYSVDVVDLANANPDYSILSYSIGDHVTLFNRKENQKQSHRIVEIDSYPEEPHRNKCVLSSRAYSIIGVQKQSFKSTDSLQGKVGITKANGDGTVSTATAGTDYVAPSYFSQATPVSLTMINGAASQGWYNVVYKSGNVGLVLLAITVSSSSGIANNTTIANLPTGYYAWQPAMVCPSGNASNTGAIGVINGIVRVSGILAKGSYTCCIPYIIA